jgi:chemotaxis protein CheZ
MTNDIRLDLARNLVKALEQGDESKADGLLDEIAGLRESQLFQEVGRLTRQLHDTMSGFSVDSKITVMTERDIPDAKERLQYVITMTEQAANQTLNAVEGLLPVSQELNEQAELLSSKWERFLDREMPFAEFKDMSAEITQHFYKSKGSLKQVQQGLNEILMAQGFQDITGQIIKRVIELVHDLETSMVELIKISGSKRVALKEVDEPDLPGPVVPGVDDKDGGVATNQDDVDDLLSSMGF